MNNTIKHLDNGDFEVIYEEVKPKRTLLQGIINWIKQPSLKETKW